MTDKQISYNAFSYPPCPQCGNMMRPYHFFLDSPGEPLAVGYDGANRVEELLNETPYAGVYVRMDVEADSFCSANCILEYIRKHLQDLQSAMDDKRREYEREDAQGQDFNKPGASQTD